MNDILLSCVTACIDKIELWRSDNKHFGHSTPEAEDILTTLRETLVTGEFNESREGRLCQELARNEYKISQAETVMLANRADPIGNMPNVAKFTAAIAEQNQIIARMKGTALCKP